MKNIIYSINAGSNIILPLLEEHYGLNNIEVKHEISNSFKCLIKALENTGVKYEDFRSSLLPADGDKHFEYLLYLQLHPIK